MSQVVVNGLITEYTDRGKGKVVILLHGWGNNLTSFKVLQTELATDCRVIAVDLPGFGNSQAPEEVWGLDDYAGFVGAFIDKLSVETYAIVGHSNGGAIALRGLSQGKLKADKLVLLASSGIRGQYKGRNAALRLVAKTGKVMVAPLPTRIKKKLRAKLYVAAGSDMLVAEHLQETFKKVVTDDVRPDADKVTIPTLLIYGDQDVATPISFAKMLAEKLVSSRLVIVPGAGHFVHLDAADQVGTEILEFLK